VIISFSSTAHITLELPHAKPLFTLSMLRRPRDAECDSALHVTVVNYPRASIFNYFSLIKVIEQRLWVKK